MISYVDTSSSTFDDVVILMHKSDLSIQSRSDSLSKRKPGYLFTFIWSKTAFFWTHFHADKRKKKKKKIEISRYAILCAILSLSNRGLSCIVRIVAADYNFTTHTLDAGQSHTAFQKTILFMHQALFKVWRANCVDVVALLQGKAAPK